MLFVLIILFFDSVILENNECHILVLGGGGDRGAWQVGAVKALAEFTDHKYDIISGSSIGGINAGLYSQSDIGDEVLGAKYLWDFWEQCSSDTFYKQWQPLGVLEGFFAKGGLFDTSPAERTFNEFFNMSKFRASKRHVYFATTEVGTEDFKVFNDTEKDILTIVTATSAIPGVFPPIEIEGKWYVDGGMTAQAPVTYPIAKCERKYPKGQVKVIVDVVYCIARLNLLPPLVEKTMLTPFIWLDTLMGFVNDMLLNDLQYARESFPDAEINVYMPNEWLPGVFILFKHDQIMDMMNKGYEETKKKILSSRK